MALWSHLLNHRALSVQGVEMADIFGKSEGVRDKRARAGASKKQDLVADFCQLIDRGGGGGRKSHLQSVLRVVS